jgi:hypothetical protein
MHKAAGILLFTTKILKNENKKNEPCQYQRKIEQGRNETNYGR